MPVTDVAELTGFPAILGHRVVTLHPKVHGGILADPTDPAHQADLAAFGIEPIALVVVNLYPFGDDPGIELIDVGGPAMVRAAAKNHAHVAVVVDPADYDAVVAEIVASGGVDAATRRRLARRAFATTADYDRAIVDWLDDTSGRRRRRRRPAWTRCASRCSERSRCATARTPTSGRRDIASTGPTAGGTPPSSTAARR